MTRTGLSPTVRPRFALFNMLRNSRGVTSFIDGAKHISLDGLEVLLRDMMVFFSP
jgi:hypothetical protein